MSQPPTQPVVYVDARTDGIPRGALRSILILQVAVVAVMVFVMVRMATPQAPATPQAVLIIALLMMASNLLGLFVQWMVYRVYWGCIVVWWVVALLVLCCVATVALTGTQVTVPRLTWP
jgi:hypothetical protein